MHVLARDGVAKVHAITAPLLAVSFVLVAAVHIPHVGVSVNGARRWIGPGQLQFQPSELLKIALVLYSATLLAKRPGCVHDLRELMRPLLTVVAGACLLVVHPARSRHRDGDRIHDRDDADRLRDAAREAAPDRRPACSGWCCCTRSCGPTRGRV